MDDYDDEELEDDDEYEEEQELPGFDDYEEDETESKDKEEDDDELQDDYEDDDDELLDDYDDEELEDDDEGEEDQELPGFEDNEDNESLEDFENIEDDEDYNINENISSDNSLEKQHNGSFSGINNKNYKYDSSLANSIKSLQNTDETTSYNIETDNLITSDQRIAAFIGTSKNGTSFIVNNLAEVFAEKGIKTAILDLTKNKNSYYIYTNGEEQLRAKAQDCIEKLRGGVIDGIQAGKNLTVYTSLPGEDQSLEDAKNIIQTLLENYTIILLDCDFETDIRYLKIAQEIYLIQSLDVLTIQPLTAFLRDLKSKNLLETEKLRIVINKYMKINRLIEESGIIGAMSNYKDPGMTYMTDLFDENTIKYTTLPFEVQTYAKYLEKIAEYTPTLKGYSKNFLASLNKLADMVYPMASKNNKKYNDYSKKNKKYENSFSESTNSTLDKMKRKY